MGGWRKKEKEGKQGEDTLTPTPPPRTHDTHTSTDTTCARATPQTHTPREKPNPTPRRRPSPRLADPTQEWRRTAPRALSQEWRGAIHQQHQRNPPARSGRGPHPGTTDRSGEGTPTQDPRPEARGHPPPPPRPTKPADLSKESPRPTPPCNIRGPKPGVAERRAQNPQSGVARDQLPPPVAAPSQEWRRHAHKRLGQEWRGASPPKSPPPHPGQGRRKTHHRNQHSERGGGGTQGAHRRRRRGTQPQGFGPPPNDRIGPT